MKSKYYFIFIVIVFIASYFLGKNIDDKQNYRDTGLEVELIKSPCDPTKTTCNISLSGHKIAYKISGNPSALKKFRVELQSSEAINSARVNFLMRDMDMGKNNYHLVSNGSNSWMQEVVLPVCSLGRKSWINQLEIELDGQYGLIEFSFEQKN